jgi:hypothetical protein
MRLKMMIAFTDHMTCAGFAYCTISGKRFRRRV